MLKKILTPSIFLILAYGFWLSPNFKEIAAGVAIFLFGMLSLEEGFKSFTGGLLEKILQRTTNRLWKALSFGVVSSTLMQSSSLVSVITISFLSAGLIGLTEGVGIIFGANIGTTTGAWLVAGFGLKVKISAYAMPMLVFGVILLFQESKSSKGMGYILVGLGFLFLGIHYMKEGFDAFKDNIDLAQFAVTGFTGLLLYALIGIIATVVMQSSHATMVLIITALSVQQITYENALALAIGANVGTTITAILGAMSANHQGKRLAGAHLLFNLVTGVIAIVFIEQFLVAVNWTSELVGIHSSDDTLKLAVFHTLFNLVGVLVMLPFIGRLVALLEQFIEPIEQIKNKAKYLNGASVDFPDTAVEAVRNETINMFEIGLDILSQGLSFKTDDILSNKDLGRIAGAQKQAIGYNVNQNYEIRIKNIYSEIISFISRATFSWEEKQSGRIHWLRNANRNIVDAIKGVQHLNKNLVKYAFSDNSSIRSEYNKIRVQIASLLRELELIRHQDPEDHSILSFDVLRAEINEADNSLNERLIRLIHNKKITPLMGTSLMNDSGYAMDICQNLIAMGESLFVNQDVHKSSVEREISLTHEEINEAIVNRDSVEEV